MSAPQAVGIVPLGGGMTIGIEQAGFETKMNLEIKGYGAAIRLNRPDIPYSYAGLDDFFDWERAAEEIAEDPPPLAYGSPPCQGFSGVNRRSAPDAAKNQFLIKAVDTATRMKAEVTILENIPRSMSLGRSMYNEMFELARRRDYTLSVHRHEVAQFGVCQRRKRVMFVLERRGHEMEWPSHPTTDAPTVREILGDLANSEPWHPSQFDVESGFIDSLVETPYAMEAQNAHQEALRNPEGMTWNHRLIAAPERYTEVPQGKQWTAMPRESMTDKERARIEAESLFNAVETYRLHPDRLAPCFTGAINKLHPDLNRYLTVREGARLMAFPDDWRWPVSNDYAQMAAGVCPPVVRWFSEVVMSELTGTALPAVEGKLF